MNTAPRVSYQLARVVGNLKTVATASLNDDCKNGVASFSLTSDVTEKRGNRWQDYSGGCNHEHILATFPDVSLFAQVARLHNSDQFGAPMHAVANLLYWLQGCFPDGLGATFHGGSGRDGKTPEQCREIFANYLRGTPEQVAELLRLAPRDAGHMSFCLERMGLRTQWQREAYAAIEEFERLTGQRFDFEATSPHWVPLSPGQLDLIEAREGAGYYAPEAVAARAAELAQAKREKLIGLAHQNHARTLAVAGRHLALRLVQIESAHRAAENVIYYTHTNTMQANWTDSHPLWGEAGWAEFVAQCQARPELAGCKYAFQAKPTR